MSSSDSTGNESCLEVDRISKLPDSVLYHILSFMETKYSIETCVLSRRWKSLWKHVPFLYFARVSATDVYVHRDTSDVWFQITIHNQLAFERLVTMSLFMNQCRSLDRFSLACFVNADKLNLFPSWISIVSTKTVRLLDLNLVSSNGISGLINLPNCIFTLESMEILRLEGDLLVGTSGLISLPRLECLSLKGVKYVCDDSVRKLIGGCPVLKSLYIERNNGFDNVTLFTVCSGTLEHLEIIVGGFASVQGNINLKLEIEAPFLKFLRLCDYVSKDFSFQRLPLLNELYLFDFNNPVMYNPAFRDKKDSNILTPDKLAEFGVLDFEYPNLLNDCKWVLDLVDEKLGEELKILSIGDEDILDYTAESRKVFSKLTKLMLFPFWEWIILLKVLDKTENLKVLILRPNCRDFNENSDKEMAPACFASSLERITVKSWLDSLDDGDCSLEDMVGIVKYFLKHGEMLERLDLSDHCEGEEVSLSLQKEFLELSRKSSACEVHIVYESPPTFVYSNTYELPLL